jgi:hypothetical protein
MTLGYAKFYYKMNAKALTLATYKAAELKLGLASVIQQLTPCAYTNNLDKLKLYLRLSFFLAPVHRVSINQFKCYVMIVTVMYLGLEL